MKAKEEAFRILEQALTIASSGVEEAEVSLAGGELGLTRFADSQVVLTSEQTHEVLAIRAVVGGKSARVETSDLSLSGLKEAAHQARLRAERLPEAAAGLGLPDPQTYEVAEAYDPETEAQKALERAAMAARAVVAALKHGLVASGSVSVRRGMIGVDGRPETYAIANTRGLLAYHPETRLRMSVLLARPGGGAGWGASESVSVSEVDVDALVGAAVERALLGAQPAPLPSARYAAVLEPAAVAELVRVLGLEAGAALAAAGTSYLAARGGEPSFDPAFTLTDDHQHPLLRGAPFDVEGVARKKVGLVSRGVAGQPVCGWESSKRLQLAPTGHRVVDPVRGAGDVAAHLVMEGGADTFGDLVGGIDRGVLIARLSGVELLDSRRLLAAGATRDGLFSIERGRLTGARPDMRFVVSLFDLFGALKGLGTPVWAQGAVVPPIRVELPLLAGASP
jgi:PmbA protein